MSTSVQESFAQALSSFQAGRLEEAERHFTEVLRHDPKHVAALNLLGILLTHLRRFADAERVLRSAVQVNSKSDATLYNYGIVLKALKRPDEALERFTQALEINPTAAETWNNRGTVLNDLRRYADAISDFDRAIALNAKYSEAFYNRGKSCGGLKRYDDAAAAFDQALALNPGLAEAWLGRGDVLFELARPSEALVAYDRALALNPGLAEGWLGRVNVEYQLRRYDEALVACDKALALNPNLTNAWLSRGDALVELKRYDEAFAAYDKALGQQSDLAEAWLGRGNIFFHLKSYADALTAYDQAIAFKHDLAAAWLGRGHVLSATKRYDEAAAAYSVLLKASSPFPFAKGMLLHQKMLSCDWAGVEGLISEIESDVVAGKLSAEPFGWQGVARSPRSLQQCAELYTKQHFPRKAGIAPAQSAKNNGKIRIGYLSGEFGDQATAHLMVGVLEQHDHSRFEIYAIDNAWDDESETRKRINAAVNGIIDISQISDDLAAAAIQNSQIDVLANLNGYFGEFRMGVFARHCAPVQINYLGFPGTLGADYIDYIVADQRVLPQNHKEFYTEKVVYLPHCYQANDDQKKIAAGNFTRAKFDLPNDAFVFCCFNNNYKILPDVFDCWMRILKQVPRSVLWLLGDNALAVSNLRKEAAARGVSPERLVFAKRVPLPDHLARHRLADLFLDTSPYNAHTTGSDALWTGLPVVTQVGDTFPGRVAASLLHAIGLPDFITHTQAEYEKLAVELATHPDKLADVREKLTRNRLTTPLFNTRLFTRHLESAYAEMYRRHQAGLPPDHFSVPEGNDC